MPLVGGRSEYRILTKREKTELWLAYLASKKRENELQQLENDELEELQRKERERREREL